MPRNMLIAILCMAMNSMCLADETTDAALAEDAGEIEAPGKGHGMVIELTDSAPAQAGAQRHEATGGLQQRKLADSDVELIIGGQGQDGIAKRSRLKKED